MKKDLKYYKLNAEEDYLTTPISVLRYIGEIERSMKIVAVVLLSLVFIFFLGGIFIGQKGRQQEIENRAKQINKECYTNQDIELIIFGEIQE